MEKSNNNSANCNTVPLPSTPTASVCDNSECGPRANGYAYRELQEPHHVAGFGGKRQRAKVFCVRVDNSLSPSLCRKPLENANPIYMFSKRNKETRFCYGVGRAMGLPVVGDFRALER